VQVDAFRKDVSADKNPQIAILGLVGGVVISLIIRRASMTDFLPSAVSPPSLE